MNEAEQHDKVPTYDSPEWNAAVGRMVESLAPRRFSVIGHDDVTRNSAILAWGFDYGGGEVLVESARDERRWSVYSPTEIDKYFPCPITGRVEIYWIDQPPTAG